MDGYSSIEELLEAPVEVVARHVNHPAKGIMGNTPLRDILRAFRVNPFQAVPVMKTPPVGEELPQSADVLGVLSLFSCMRSSMLAASTEAGVDAAVLKDMNWDTTAADYLGACEANSEESSFYFCEATVPFKTLVEVFARGVHRVITTLPHNSSGHGAVLGSADINTIAAEIPDKRFDFYVVSQSDVVALLYRMHGRVPNSKLNGFLAATVEQNAFETPEYPFQNPKVRVVEGAIRAVDAFAHMARRELRACPVVNKNDSLVGVISAADFREIYGDDYSVLFDKSVIDYLAHAAAHSSRGSGAVRSPICVEVSAPVERVVALMVLERVHQVWIVDHARRPIGCISMTDLMGKFMETVA